MIESNKDGGKGNKEMNKEGARDTVKDSKDMTSKEISKEFVPIKTSNGEYDTKTKLFVSPVTLALDDYDDIFSDFDPRPYSQRSLSDDFLNEAKKATRDNENKVELMMLIPKNKRNPHQEHIIKKRLREHFVRHANLEQEKMKKIMLNGLIFIVLGTIVMLIKTYFQFSGLIDASFLVAFIAVWIDAPGWFLIWEGLHLIVFESKEKMPEAEFYMKMSDCDINFVSY